MIIELYVDKDEKRRLKVPHYLFAAKKDIIRVRDRQIILISAILKLVFFLAILDFDNSPNQKNTEGNTDKQSTKSPQSSHQKKYFIPLNHMRADKRAKT